ncbi:MAG: hypothetical protein ACLFTH_04270, partial [Candidatus Woesearchaeota archaeon]
NTLYRHRLQNKEGIPNQTSTPALSSHLFFTLLFRIANNSPGVWNAEKKACESDRPGINPSYNKEGRTGHLKMLCWKTAEKRRIREKSTNKI